MSAELRSEVRNSYSVPDPDAYPVGTWERGEPIPSVLHDWLPRRDRTVTGSKARLVGGELTIGAVAVYTSALPSAEAPEMPPNAEMPKIDPPNLFWGDTSSHSRPS